MPHIPLNKGGKGVVNVSSWKGGMGSNVRRKQPPESSFAKGGLTNPSLKAGVRLILESFLQGSKIL